MSKLLIYTDGGSRGNPGPAALGVFVTDEAGTVVHEVSQYLGIGTNNEAEYEAFSASLKWLLSLESLQRPDQIWWQLDSKLVVEQLNRHWKIKEDRLRQKAQACWAMLEELAIPYVISHILRDKNKEADLLVNQALDAATT